MERVEHTLNDSIMIVAFAPLVALLLGLASIAVGIGGRTVPYAFAARPVFVAGPHMERMAQVIGAIESVVASPGYRETVLANAPAIARHNPGGAKGVFFGYDFHIGERGVGLIEINTNAGGAMLNAALARAQRACCASIEALLPPQRTATALEQQVVDMFHTEWALSQRDRALRTIAIVDDAPEQQYLYPEFLLFQQLFERHGIKAVIADPTALTRETGRFGTAQSPLTWCTTGLPIFRSKRPPAPRCAQHIWSMRWC